MGEIVWTASGTCLRSCTGWKTAPAWKWTCVSVKPCAAGDWDRRSAGITFLQVSENRLATHSQTRQPQRLVALRHSWSRRDIPLASRAETTDRTPEARGLGLFSVWDQGQTEWRQACLRWKKQHFNWKPCWRPIDLLSKHRLLLLQVSIDSVRTLGKEQRQICAT